MFTGLIEDIGKIIGITDFEGGKIFTVQTSLDASEIKIGDSVAINGACQTVIKKEKNFLTFEAMKETIKRTNFNFIEKGSFVNLERACKLNSRLDGHMVSGHVDLVSKLNSVKKEGSAYVFEFEANTDLIVEKGSIALNGVSLTVSDVLSDSFKVWVLPHTLDNTNFKFLNPCDMVNVEYDMIAKYINKFVSPKNKTRITEEFLIQNGF